MIPWLVKLLLPIVLGYVGRELASLFSGACPLTPDAFICQHWVNIATIAGSILGLFGFAVKRPSITARSNALVAKPSASPGQLTITGPLNQIGYVPKATYPEAPTATERPSVRVEGPLNQITSAPPPPQSKKPMSPEKSTEPRNKQTVSGPLNQIGYSEDDEKH